MSAELLQARRLQAYDCEDSARAALVISNKSLAGDGGYISCNLFVTRLGPIEANDLTVYGEFGSLSMNGNKIQLSLLGQAKTTTFGKLSMIYNRLMLCTGAELPWPFLGFRAIS